MPDNIASVRIFFKPFQDLLEESLARHTKGSNQTKQVWETGESEEAETTLNRKSCGSIDNHLWTRRQNSLQPSAVQKGSCEDILVQGKEN